jgi:hypothetical protein
LGIQINAAAVAVQEKLAAYKRKLDHAFVSATDAWTLQRFCTNTLDDALVRLHTPTVSSTSSDSDGTGSLTDPEWLQLMGRSPQRGRKFAMQQEQLAAVQGSAKKIADQIDQLLTAASQIAALRVRVLNSYLLAVACAC